MTKSLSRSFKPPRWVQIACCVTPLILMYAICIGIAFGVEVNPITVFILATLTWNVITTALRIPKTSLVGIPEPLNLVAQTKNQTDQDSAAA